MDGFVAAISLSRLSFKATGDSVWTWLLDFRKKEKKKGKDETRLPKVAVP